jgi:hypothetical protein
MEAMSISIVTRQIYLMTTPFRRRQLSNSPAPKYMEIFPFMSKKPIANTMMSTTSKMMDIMN